MPLTPEDVSNKRFTPVRLREGYDMGEVDQFLDEVESELLRLTTENDDLRSRLTATQQQDGPPPADSATQPPTPAQPVPEPTDRAGSAAAETGSPTDGSPGVEPGPSDATATPGPVRTEQTGPVETIKVATVGEASTAAARLLEIAARNADELVDDAKGRADSIIGEARTKAERLESESQTKAERMESEARTRSQLLDSETAERRQQLFGDLEREKGQLDTEVQGLRSFEREYRSRLRGYFQQQLSALDGGVAADPDPDAEAAPGSSRLGTLLGEEDERRA